MLIYIVIFSILITTAIWDIIKPRGKDLSVQIFWSLIVILVLFKGLRWDTGTDFPQYYATFENAKWSNIFSFHRGGVGSTLMEPGYVFLNVLVRTVAPHYTFFLLLTNAAILYVYGSMIIRYIPQYKFTALALLIIATILFPVRQTLAVAVYCYSIRYVLSKEFKKFLLMIIVCFSIHRSALMLVVTYPILQSEFKLKRSLAIYIALIFAGEIMYSVFDWVKNSPLNVLMAGILNTYDATNENMQAFDEENASSRTLTYISSVIQLSLYYYGYSKMKSHIGNSQFFNVLLNMYLCSLCITVITFIPGFGSMNRLPAYFEYAYPLIVTLTVCYFCKLRKKVLLGVLLFLGVFYIKFKASTIGNPGSLYYDEAFVPYKSFLQSDEPMRQGIWIY